MLEQIVAVLAKPPYLSKLWTVWAGPHAYAASLNITPTAENEITVFCTFILYVKGGILILGAFYTIKIRETPDTSENF